MRAPVLRYVAFSLGAALGLGILSAWLTGPARGLTEHASVHALPERGDDSPLGLREEEAAGPRLAVPCPSEPPNRGPAVEHLSAPASPAWQPEPGSPLWLLPAEDWPSYHPDKEWTARWLRRGLLNGAYSSLTDEDLDTLWEDRVWRRAFLASREAAALRHWCMGWEQRARKAWEEGLEHVSILNELERAQIAPDWTRPIQRELSEHAREAFLRWQETPGGADTGEPLPSWPRLYDALLRQSEAETAVYVRRAAVLAAERDTHDESRSDR